MINVKGNKRGLLGGWSDEKRQEVLSVYSSGSGCVLTAKKTGVPFGTVVHWVNCAGIMRKSRVGNRKYFGGTDEDILRVYATGESTRQTAKILGASNWRVRKVLIREGALRSHGVYSEEFRQEACALYDGGMTKEQVGLELGIKPLTVLQWTRERGVSRPRYKAEIDRLCAVYLMEFSGYGEKFWKVGLSMDPASRFRTGNAGYSTKILDHRWHDSVKAAFAAEAVILENSAEYSYVPARHFIGCTECFSKPLSLDIKANPLKLSA